VKKLLILLVISVLLLTSCKKNTVRTAEILIPSYEEDGGYIQTYTVKETDLVSTKTVAAKFGCPYAAPVLSPVSGNITQINTDKKEFKQGEVIAAVSSAESENAREAKQMSVNSARARYDASGSERDRLLWLIEAEELSRLDCEVEMYAVKAPYDCIVLNAAGMKEGDFVETGYRFCEIARFDEVYAYINESPEMFAVGMDVTIGMGNFTYDGKVAACPGSAPSVSAAARQRLTVIKPSDGETEKILADVPSALGAGWATLFIPETDLKGVIAVPDSAVSDGYCVLAKDGKTMRIAVETGVSANGYTVILGGLFPGDEVAV